MTNSTVKVTLATRHNFRLSASVFVYDVFAERMRNKSKIRDPAGIQAQDLLNTSQTLLPLSHLDPGRGAEDKLHKQHCLEDSAEFQPILTLSSKNIVHEHFH